MSYDPNDCQVGDLFLYPGKGWIGAFSNGIEHISFVVEADKIPPMIGEAHAWTQNDKGKYISGTLRKTFNPKWKVRQFRLIGGLSEEQKLRLVNWFADKHEGKDAYNIVSFPFLWFWGTILQPLGFSNINLKVNSDGWENCGELADVLYSDALGIDLFPNMARKMVTPGQFLRSPVLYEINPTQIATTVTAFQSDWNQLQPA